MSCLMLKGVALRKVVRDATTEVLDGLVQLLEVILASPGERFYYIHIVLFSNVNSVRCAVLSVVSLV